MHCVPRIGAKSGLRSAQQTEKLILKLAKHTGWGCTRILAELQKLRGQWLVREHVSAQQDLTDQLFDWAHLRQFLA